MQKLDERVDALERQVRALTGIVASQKPARIGARP